MHTKKVPVLGANGKPEYLLGISEDITERKQDEAEKTKLQAQLRQAQKMEAVGLLAGGVAHDFNNLLTIINGLAEISISELSPLDPLLPRLQGIRDAGNRAANLTRQLLAFARQQVVCPRALDLNETIGSMEKMLHRLIGEDIEFVWKPGTDIWCIYLDPSQVDQILANLVINARDAIPGVGTITIETSNTVIDEVYCATHVGTLPGEYAMLVITDTGVGMNHETLSRIFEPFFTTKEFGKGTGLGLATVYGIVKQAGGSIYAYSEPGQGTIMRIYLPRWYGGIAAAVIRDDLPKSLQGTETVLLVEDEERVLDVGREILKRQGYRVITALTPGEALLAAEKEPGTIHLLATDVVMPSMNGRELYERLQVQRPKLKCLYLSGYPSDAITQRGVLPEGVHFLQKPYSLKGLIAKVRAVLDEK
jgi:signal transduction histidine kinase/CheY-like chemotaxis protein